MNNIFIISFDGLHNNGKTTQIALLADELKRNNISVLIRRGDGMRKGEGREINDPVSEWWKENIARMRATGFEGPASMAAATEASNRLNSELYVAKNYFMPHMIKDEKSKAGVILLDRGPISRIFVKRREDPTAGLDSIDIFENLSGKHAILLPDKIFLFHAPLDILIARNCDRTSEKSKFNETVLSKYYGDFENVVSNLPDELRARTMQIDSTKSIDEIGQIVRASTLGLIESRTIEGRGRDQERC